ncbi:hypothetical protein MRB53_022575 [Persea americana]|uniref:Uncharacterized protein n=1 Tax=Persea americana TaxID=3435 RepID=A0ACC2L813_PERAE|nr:hypothetical protein MRB53_022575 [Persea americana]
MYSRRHPLRVVTMNLTGLQLAGSLSPFVPNLTFLHAIDLSNNKLIGQIPTEIGLLFRLRIPVELGSFSRLNWLNLGGNNLIGSIPNSLRNLSSLSHLSLWTSGLEGSIPEELGQIRSLSIFSVTGNKLSGTIPLALRNLSSMAVFSVTQNQLHGNLPLDLGITLPNIVEFYVAKNQFTGPIPTSLNNASRLELLELSLNRLTGAIPMNLGRLEGLRSLNLENNTLGSGKVEDLGSLSSLTNCSLLEILSVSYNRLRGALPTSIANFSATLQYLYLGKNQILGNIPSGIGNLFNLIILHISICSIVHCDLKPSNILLDDDMNAHVGDFGLARFLSEATSSCSQDHTNSLRIKGTIGYLAPGDMLYLLLFVY